MPVSIRKLVEAYLEKPFKTLLFNYKTGEALYLKLPEWEAYVHGRYMLPEFCPDFLNDYVLFDALRRDYIQDFRLGFLEGAAIESLIPSESVHSTPKFNKLLRENDLWDDYVDAFIELKLPQLADLSFIYGFEDVEATKGQYLEIRKLMEEYDAENFESFVADCDLFTLNGTGLFGTCFIVMGNAGQTFGLSFYRGENGENNYRSFMRESDYPHHGTELSLMAPTVSLYSNIKTPGPDLPFENPFGSDDLYTSIAWAYGRKYDCYLPSMLARALIRQIRAVIDALKACKKQLKRERVADRDVDIMVWMGQGKVTCHIFPRDAYALSGAPSPVSRLFYEESEPPALIEAKPNKEEWFFSFRLLPQAIFPLSDDEIRCVHLSFVAIIGDKKSGLIKAVRLIAPTKGISLVESVYDQFEGQIEDMGRPKTIYVNDYLDWEFARFIFWNYLEAGTKLKPYKGLTTCDDAYEGLKNLNPDDDIPKA